MHLECVTSIKALVAHVLRWIKLRLGVVDFIFNGKLINRPNLDVFFYTVLLHLHCFCCILYRNHPAHPQMTSDTVHHNMTVRHTLRQAREQALYLWLGFYFLSPFHCSLSLSPSLLQSTAGPPSLWSVSMLFHLACCYRGLGAGRLQLASQSFSIYLSSPLPHLPPLRLALAPVGINPHAHTYSHLSDPPSISLLLPPILPFSIGRENLARKLRDKKEILCQGKRLSWRRQPGLCYYLGLCHHRWPQRVESIDRLSLKAFSRLHWQSLSRPLIARLAALAEAQEKSLTEAHYMVAFNQSPGPQSGLITVRK